MHSTEPRIPPVGVLEGLLHRFASLDRPLVVRRSAQLASSTQAPPEHVALGSHAPPSGVLEGGRWGRGGT